MIHSYFGCKVKLLERLPDGDQGEIWVRALREESGDIRTYSLADLRADGGIAEIMTAVDALPTQERA
jgi:hypothetical protein